MRRISEEFTSEGEKIEWETVGKLGGKCLIQKEKEKEKEKESEGIERERESKVRLVLTTRKVPRGFLTS